MTPPPPRYAGTRCPLCGLDIEKRAAALPPPPRSAFLSTLEIDFHVDFLLRSKTTDSTFVYTRFLVNIINGISTVISILPPPIADHSTT